MPGSSSPRPSLGPPTVSTLPNKRREGGVGAAGRCTAVHVYAVTSRVGAPVGLRIPAAFLPLPRLWSGTYSLFLVVQVLLRPQLGCVMIKEGVVD